MDFFVYDLVWCIWVDGDVLVISYMGIELSQYGTRWQEEGRQTNRGHPQRPYRERRHWVWSRNKDSTLDFWSVILTEHTSPLERVRQKSQPFSDLFLKTADFFLVTFLAFSWIALVLLVFWIIVTQRIAIKWIQGVAIGAVQFRAPKIEDQAVFIFYVWTGSFLLRRLRIMVSTL